MEQKINLTEFNASEVEQEAYSDYCYFFTLMQDFKSLGIDTDKELSFTEFTALANTVTNLYEIDLIEEIGLPDALKKLENDRIKRSNYWLRALIKEEH